MRRRDFLGIFGVALVGQPLAARAQSAMPLIGFLHGGSQREWATPTSSYAIMRRVRPYRGENSGPGKDDRGELDTQIRN
jgi:hypothetical protein